MSVEAQNPTQQTIKHEWYQSESNVVITVFIKGTNKDNLQIQTNDDTVQVRRVDGEPLVNLEFHLSHKVSPNDTQVKYLSTKVEIKLKKLEVLHWDSLERKQEAKEVKVTYPTSSKNPKDWDHIVQDIKNEEKDEKLEGDAALNKLFQQIYSDGSEETRRAMNKSFMESGGTVLSTNWKDIGEKKVEVKPPDGLEFKKWDS